MASIHAPANPARFFEIAHPSTSFQVRAAAVPIVDAGIALPIWAATRAAEK